MSKFETNLGSARAFFVHEVKVTHANCHLQIAGLRLRYVGWGLFAVKVREVVASPKEWRAENGVLESGPMGEIEKVLVVERQVLERLGLFQGVSFEVDRYLPQLWEGKGVRFIARPEAERDPGYKQLIPYVIMAYGDSYLCYARGRGTDEPRLAEKVSIGIGGHINPSDTMPLFHENLQQVYLNAVAREVAEEVRVGTEHEDKIVGLINDDSNEVGQVHFGIVHFWRLAEPSIQKRERDICGIRFMR
jgi:predicted NUDIX family phosphoesterase